VLETELVEQLVDIAGEAGYAVAEMGLARPAVTTQVERDDLPIGGQVGDWCRNIAWVWPQPCSMTSVNPFPPRSS
jgi:hypothetical protein